jgi:hypothetical protein
VFLMEGILPLCLLLFFFFFFFLLVLVLLLQSVGPAETRLAHCNLSKLIVLSPVFGSPVHLQRRSTSEWRERPLLAKGGFGRVLTRNFGYQRPAC